MPDPNARELNMLSRYRNAMKANIGEISIPPIGGTMNLKGAKIESDICSSNLRAGCLLLLATQLMIIPPNITQNETFKQSIRTEYKDQIVIFTGS